MSLNKFIYVCNILFAIVGLIIIFIIAIVAMIDSAASDLVSSIPSSILGASLFISGYIGINLQKKIKN